MKNYFKSFENFMLMEALGRDSNYSYIRLTIFALNLLFKMRKVEKEGIKCPGTDIKFPD